MSLLKQDITRKKLINKLNPQLDFYCGEGKGNKYNVKAIWDNTVYTKELKTGAHLPSLFYLVL